MMYWWEPVLVVAVWVAVLAAAAAWYVTQPRPQLRPTTFLPTVDVVLHRNTTLNTVPPPIVDGVFLKSGMRVLVIAQELPSENDVFTVQPDSTWRRDPVRVRQAAVYVRRGQNHKGTTWVVRHPDGADHETHVVPSTDAWFRGPDDSVWTADGWQPWRDRRRVPVTLEGHDVYELPWPKIDGDYQFQLGDGQSYVQARIFVQEGRGCGDLSRALTVDKHPPKLQCHPAGLRIRVPFPDKTYRGLWLAAS